MSFRLGPALAVLLLAAILTPPASAQTHRCPVDDSLLLIFRNPDLQPGADGFIRAQGQFFVQFQAIGAAADQIAVFGFSFGPFTHDFDEQSCGVPEGAPWVTGAYIPNYRADRDATDGFFIPIKTSLVPDGTYAAAVHAYDVNNNEMARFWAKAIVDNCDTQPTPAQETCEDEPAQMQAHDKTAPWPIVLPGDGQALAGHKLTIEFGEPLAKKTVSLNGQDITAELRDWDGRLWDADYSPDYGPGGAAGIIAPPCSGAPGQTCVTYGPSFEWTGRDLTANDVIRVEAFDLAGNRAVKDIHIGSSVAGGAVTDTQPILSYTVDQIGKATGPGQSATFHFNITNNGAGVGHPFAKASVPAAWGCTTASPCFAWDPVHVVVNPGATMPQKLVVTPPAAMASGAYDVNATLTYTSNGKEIVLAQTLKLDVLGGTGPVATSSTTDTQASPMPLAAMAIVAALLAARRRR